MCFLLEHEIHICCSNQEETQTRKRRKRKTHEQEGKTQTLKAEIATIRIDKNMTNLFYPLEALLCFSMRGHATYTMAPNLCNNPEETNTY